MKKLETDHTKAVKAALEALRVTGLPTALPVAEQAAHEAEMTAKNRRSGPLFEEAKRLRRHVRRMRAKNRFAPPECGYIDARKGLPPVRYTNEAPDYLIEIAPGEYATREAAGL
ncbi:MAG: hypothetical protein JO362_15830 [Streptomycetaceae bacterium]|nr:hypothetical protein [Streptomycetaceae bacterium]